MFARPSEFGLTVEIGTGFHTRDRHEQDIDDEVDIDGDDQAFGDVQFTEGDILGPNPAPVVEEDVEVEIEGDDDDELRREQMSLRDLVAEGKVVRRTIYGEQADDLKAKMDEVMGVGESDGMNLAILAARKRGDQTSLIFALESKVKQLVSVNLQLSTTRNSCSLKGIHASIILNFAVVSNMS